LADFWRRIASRQPLGIARTTDAAHLVISSGEQVDDPGRSLQQTAPPCSNGLVQLGVRAHFSTWASASVRHTKGEIGSAVAAGTVKLLWWPRPRRGRS
jgi:hypothetical protein